MAKQACNRASARRISPARTAAKSNRSRPSAPTRSAARAMEQSPAPCPIPAARRSRLLYALAGALLLACGGWLAYANAGRYLESAQQDPIAADLIVCVGGDRGERVKKSAELYRRGYARRILLLGAMQLPQVPGRPAPASREQVLLELGIPREAILLDPMASSSLDEARRTRHLMVERGWHRALVVSDPPHMRRLAWLWEREFDGSGREFVLIATAMRGWNAGTWWRHPWSAEFVRTEYLKLAYALLKP